MPLITSTSESEVRFCSGCEKEVYQCVTDEELTNNVRLNRCVAITRSSHSEEDMLLGYITPESLVSKIND